MLELMGYGCLIALLMGLAAWLGERWLGALRWPRRWIWIAALLAAFAVPIAVVLPSPERTGAAVSTTPSRAVAVPPRMERSGMASLVTAVTVAESRRGEQLDASLLWLWVSTSAALLIGFAASYWGLRHKLHSLPRVCIDGVELRITDELGPAVFGLLKPLIILPRWLLEAPAATRSLVIAHEQAHLRAGDPLLFALALLLVTLVPWNLSLWWQLRRLRSAIEVDCDQRVLRRGGDVTAYGEALLAVAQHRSHAPLGAMAIAESTSQLQHRFLAMTTTRSSGAQELLLACALGSLTVTVATQVMPPVTLVALASRITADPQMDVVIPRIARPLAPRVEPEFAPPMLPTLPAVLISTPAVESVAAMPTRSSQLDIDTWWVLANDAFKQYLEARVAGTSPMFSAVAQLDVPLELLQAEARGEIIRVAQPRARATDGREFTVTAPAQLSFQQFSADDQLTERVMDVLLHLTATLRLESNEAVDLAFHLTLEPANNAFGASMQWRKRLQRGEAVLIEWPQNEPLLGPTAKQGDKDHLYIFIKPRSLPAG